MIGGYEGPRNPDLVYGRISQKKLARMLKKYAEKSSDVLRKLGKVWLAVPERGFFRAHRIQLVVAEIEASKSDSTEWILRGLVCNATPSAFYSWEYGSAYEILYSPAKQEGVQERWKVFPYGATTGDMQDLTKSLA